MQTRTELVSLGTLSSSSAATVAGAYVFQVDDLPGYTALLGSFDQYRLIMVELIVKSIVTPALPGLTANGDSHLLMAVDFDNNSAPTSLGELAQYGKQTRILLGPGQSGVLQFEPTTKTTVDDGASTFGAILPRLTWIDFVAPATVYYGVKYFIPQSTTTSVTRWSVWAEVTYQCRSQV